MPKITPKRRELSKTSAPKKAPVKKRKESVGANPLPIEPKDREMPTRIQTAEGWKREQLRKRAERQGNE